ncbi:TonB-dependent receptor [Opitutales bacterium ASA1]|uniref:TonB-dependent receptor domain-containing protein n=1 Tax=Congregicoccus parvus TaxID=3081749 RepID=UPI002B2A7856|nr:TonB-dependent receptor [Opitutales bacterium ASA1]
MAKLATTFACLAAGATFVVAAAEEEIVALDAITVETDAVRKTPWHVTGASFTPVSTISRQDAGSWLATLPGAVVQPGFGAIDPPRISWRGSGLQSAPVSRGVVWLLDGLPLHAADGSFHSALVVPGLVGPITHRGHADPAGVTTTAAGGVLALRSDLGSAARSIAVGSGNQGTRSAQVLAPGLGLAWTSTDGWRPHHSQERLALAGRVEIPATGSRPRLALGLQATRVRFDVPGPLTLAMALEQPATISAVAAVDRPRREADFARATVETTWADLGAWSVVAAGGAQYTQDFFRQLRANGVAEASGFDAMGALTARRVFGAHRFAAGVSAQTGRREQERFFNVGGETGARFAEVALAATGVSVWVRDAWEIAPGFTATGSAVFTHSRRRIGGDPPSAVGTATAARVDPRFEFEWRPVARTGSVFAAIGRIHESPTWDDLVAVRGAASALSVAFVGLRPQRIDTVEVGARWIAGGFTMRGVVYAARWDCELLRLAAPDGSARGTVNADATQHQGLESSASWTGMLGERPIVCTVVHTWSRARFVDDPVHGSKRLAGLPPHAGRLELASEPREGVTAAATAAWIGGRTWVDHDNTLGYDGHVICGARIGWRDRRGWSLELSVSNVFDRRWIASSAGVLDRARQAAATAVFLPGAPRTWQVAFGRPW